MRCDTAIQLLPLQNDDEFLAVHERHALESHLAECAACRQVANGYLADRMALSEVASGLEAGPAPAILSGFAASVMERLGRDGGSVADVSEPEASSDLLAADLWEAAVVSSAQGLASQQPAQPVSRGWRTASVAAAAAVVVGMVWWNDRPQPSDPQQASQPSDPVSGQPAQEFDLAQDLPQRRIRVIRFADQDPRRYFYAGETVRVPVVRQGGNGQAPEGLMPLSGRLEFGVERAGPSDTAWGL